jgi:hypothetical protein
MWKKYLLDMEPTMRLILCDYLPKPKDIDTKNYLNDTTLKTLDTILEKTENQNEKILKQAQKLFDALLKQSERFELYM